MAIEKYEHWRLRLAETDITTVRAEVANTNIHSGATWKRAGEAVIKEYEEKQEDERAARRDEREEKP